MRAVVYTAPEVFSVEDVADVPLGSGQVRVANEVVGVCGTDQHLHIGEFGPVYPLTPGHEIVGRVIEAAPDVVGIEVGDRVAVDNTIYCRHCTNCKRGGDLHLVRIRTCRRTV
jgi:D-arabinitol dehydrogenase (NADP+)